MRNWIAAIVTVFAALPGLSLGAGGGEPLMHMKVDYSKETLRKGARTFVDNCMGCHSAKFYRYKNLVDHLGMDRGTVEDDLMYGMVSVNDHMMSAMPKGKGKDWFGAEVPDLSLVTRVRGTDWVYSYLLAFYQDSEAANGWNNHVFPNASMPNVLVRLTEDSAGYYTEAMPKPHHGEGDEGHFEYPEVPEKLDGKVQNLVSFLSYVGDPSVLARHSMGPWVLLFLAVLAVLTFLVKKEYWRDIH